MTDLRSSRQDDDGDGISAASLLSQAMFLASAADPRSRTAFAAILPELRARRGELWFTVARLEWRFRNDDEMRALLRFVWRQLARETDDAGRSMPGRDVRQLWLV